MAEGSCISVFVCFIRKRPSETRLWISLTNFAHIRYAFHMPDAVMFDSNVDIDLAIRSACFSYKRLITSNDMLTCAKLICERSES